MVFSFVAGRRSPNTETGGLQRPQVPISFPPLEVRYVCLQGALGRLVLFICECDEIMQQPNYYVSREIVGVRHIRCRVVVSRQ